MRRRKNKSFLWGSVCLILLLILSVVGCGKETASSNTRNSEPDKTVQEEAASGENVSEEQQAEIATGEKTEEVDSAEDKRNAEQNVEEDSMNTDVVNETEVNEQSSGEQLQGTVEGVVVPKEERPAANQEDLQPAPRPEFPISIEDGKISIESVFQYSGINLDCEDEFCENIGAVQVKNTSTDYLESADITVNLSDGSTMNFHVADLPVGDSIIAFEVKNSFYDVTKSVGEISADVVWNDDASLQQENLSFAVNGTNITVKNISGKTLQDLTVKYHCDLEGIYFGGKSYERRIEVLDAGESITLDASECYLGVAAVVNVLD